MLEKDLDILKVFVSTADVSGDRNAAWLINDIKNRGIKAEFKGFGAFFMKRAGCDIVEDFRTDSFMFIPPIKQIPFLFLKFHFHFISRLESLLSEYKPNIVILFSGSFINLSVALMANKMKIPVIYIFPPEIWSRKFQKRNVSKVLSSSSCIVTTNPIEYQFYMTWKQKLNSCTEVVYFGHPFRDLLVNRHDSPHEVTLKIKNDIERWKLHSNPSSLRIGLFPGSRVREIKHLLPTMIEAACMISSHIEDDPPQFIIAEATGYLRELICEIITEHLRGKEKKPMLKIVSEPGYRVIRACDFIITKSGTVTMEALCLSTPMVVTYKVPFLIKIVVPILRDSKAKYISWPNILAKEKIVEELVQGEVTTKNIFQAVLPLLDEKFRKHKEDQLREIANTHLERHALSKISTHVLKFLSAKEEDRKHVGEKEFLNILNNAQSEQLLYREEQRLLHGRKQPEDIFNLLRYGVKLGFVKNPSYRVTYSFVNRLRKKTPGLFQMVNMHSEELSKIPFFYKCEEKLEIQYFLKEVQARIFNLLSKDELEFNILADAMIKIKKHLWCKKSILTSIIALWVLDKELKKKIIERDKEKGILKLVR